MAERAARDIKALVEPQILIHQTLTERVDGAPDVLKREILALEARLAGLEGERRDRTVEMVQQARGALRLINFLRDGGTATDFALSLEDTPLPAVGYTLVMFGSEAIQLPLAPYVTPRTRVTPASPESTTDFRRQAMDERGV